MLKWFVTVVVALVVLSAFTPWLARIGFGRLPGDFRFKRRGVEYSVPVTSTVLLSALLTALTWLLRL
jgi:hypothetical protein